jgi:signal transduction histidine kinase
VLYLDHHGIAGLFGNEHAGLLKLISGLLASALCVVELDERIGRADRELAETHAHIMRAERNRVAGEIASGIAHDLKNVLAAIVARSQLVRLATPDGAIRKHVKAIEQAAHSGASLIGRLQECSREHGLLEEETVDLVAAAHEALELLRPRFTQCPGRTGAPITAHVDGDCGAFVMGRPGEIRELFLNLLVNACDAMPHGGDVAITFTVDHSTREAEIVIRDTGSGMPESVRNRAFEPFFTTKAKGGTGLGLVVVRNTVVRYGGSIEIESAEGRGTTFRIRLPLLAGSTGPAPPGSSPSDGQKAKRQ